MELIDKLREHTIELKEKYIEQTIQWAEKNFDYQIKKSKWNEADWCEHFDLEPRICNKGLSSEFLSFPKGFFNTAISKTYDSQKTNAIRIFRLGKDEYIKRQVIKAKNHYETSLLKLCLRIEKKELNLKKLDVISSWVGINLNMTFSDGEKIVNAWTIIAEGQIQRPHYRYLVK